MDDYGIPISRSPSYLSTQYFPHFMITMVVIYVLGNGAVTMTLILCLTAVAVGLMIRDHVLGFGYSEFGSPQEVHAYDSGYKKGYLDGLRDNGGTSFHPHLGRRSNSNPILHGRQRLMGPPVVDRASLRMHMLHHSVVRPDYTDVLIHRPMLMDAPGTNLIPTGLIFDFGIWSYCFGTAGNWVASVWQGLCDNWRR